FAFPLLPARTPLHLLVPGAPAPPCPPTACTHVAQDAHPSAAHPSQVILRTARRSSADLLGRCAKITCLCGRSPAWAGLPGRAPPGRLGWVVEVREARIVGRIPWSAGRVTDWAASRVPVGRELFRDQRVPLVAVVCDYALDYVGGAQTALVEQARALAAAGCGVVVVSPSSADAVRRAGLGDDVD